MTALDLLRPFTTNSAQHRGWEYIDRVDVLDGTPTHVDAEVRGGEIYETSIRLQGQTLRVSCSCPYFSDRASGCKHLWAVALVADENGWLNDLPSGMKVVVDVDDLEDHPLRRDSVPYAAPRPHVVGHDRPAAASRERKPADWAIALDAIAPATKVDAAPGLSPGSQLLYVIAAPLGATLTEVPLHFERRERKRDGSWAKPQAARLTLASIPHLPDEHDRWALSLIHSTSAYPREYGGYDYGVSPQIGTHYVRGPLLDLLLPRLCPTGRVFLRQAQLNVLPLAKSDNDIALSWDDGEPWRLVVVVTRENAGFRADAVLARGEARESIHNFSLLTDAVAVLNGVAARFDPMGALAWARHLRSHGTVAVPASEQRKLIDTLIRSGVQHVDLPADLQWEERQLQPRFRVTIAAPNEFTGACPVHAQAVYGDVPGPLGGTAPLPSDDRRALYRRDVAAERDAMVLLKRLGVSAIDPLTFQRPEVTYRKVPAMVHALVAAGWDVQAEGVRYRALEAPRLRIRSNIDWFEIEAEDSGGAQVDIGELLKAMSSGRRTVTLGDGSIGMLPEDWLARVAPVLMIAEAAPEGGTVRFKPSQVALIDALLAAQPAVDWDEGFARAREALRRFEGVRAEDAPAGFHGELREYQREALGWMRFLRDFGFGGCLADDMGLGKTVMVLAMLEARRLDRHRVHRPSLIVLPRSLLFNWTSEAVRFTPDLRVLDFAHADRHSVADAITYADIVLTTYGTLRRDVVALQQHQFDYVVLDEAQAIKNAGTATAKAARLLRADHRLALTGTPVENHLGELQSLFDFLNPGLLGRGRILDVRDNEPDYIARLAKGLRPFILRRTKEQVAPELPPRTEETLYCELEGEQRKLYEGLRQHYRQALLAKIERDGLAKSKFQVLEALLRLRQAACHTALVEKRASIVDSSAKFELLLPRLAELVEEGRKALVFSQFTSLLALLRRRLDADGVTYEYLDGETQDRGAHVERFQQDPACPLFLISLKAGGVGLNLTAAEYVFLLDPWWNPAVEMQAIDRTHRIGQSKPVFAYRLVARGTVEERILELQARKRELADAILEAGTGGLRGLQREDLEHLLS